MTNAPRASGIRVPRSAAAWLCGLLVVAALAAPAQAQAPDPQCGVEGWPDCDHDPGRYPDGSNNGTRDSYHDDNETPQDDSEPEEEEDPVGEAVQQANETADNTSKEADNQTGPVVRQVRAQLNRTTGLVDITWIVGEDEEESDADRYAIYKNGNNESMGEEEHQPGQPSYKKQDRSHPEGNTTYTVVPIYETANGTVNGNGTSSDPEEFEPFPEGTGDEIRKCGPLDNDTDLDAICDMAEEVLGTNPLLADSDGDGIPDPLALRWGLVAPRAPDHGAPEAAPEPVVTPTPVAGPPAREAEAETPLIVHGVLGLGTSLTAAAVGAMWRFRRP